MISLALVLLIFGALGAAMIAMNAILGPKRKILPLKAKPFECGSPPLQEGVNPMPVKFYAAALMFILFDIEIVFFIPWALVFKEMGRRTGGLAAMAAYLVVLGAGLAYALKKRALELD